jgi:hypothetical protein
MQYLLQWSRRLQGLIKPERELNRIELEQSFMRAREKFYSCAGWKGLSLAQKRSIEARFLRVFVVEQHLMPEKNKPSSAGYQAAAPCLFRRLLNLAQLWFQKLRR